MPKSLKAYEDVIRDITSQIADYPESEKHPWTSSELGMGCAEMPLKSATGYNQVGDYIFTVGAEEQSSSIIWGNLVVERKTLEDLYGTLMNKEHRSRLYREISKYEADPRFNRFMLVAECTYEEFLTYVPEIFVYTQESADATIYKNLIKYFKRFYKIHILPHQN